MPPQSGSLRTHRLILRSAQAGALLFAWIFIFEYFTTLDTPHEAAVYTALAFCLAHLVSFLLTPFSARAVRNGIRSRTAQAIIALALSYLVLGAALWGVITPVWGILAFAILFGTYRALYWISYQAHMAGGARGITRDLFVALMPLIFGYLAVLLPDPAAALVLAGILVCLSLVPHMRTPDVIERFPWSVGETFAEFLRPNHRALVLRAAADGAQAAALFLLWPLAVFMLLERSYPLLGIVFSLTLVTVLIVRNLMRRLPRTSTLNKPSVRAAHLISAWVFRLIAATPVAIIAVGVYAHAHGNDRDETDILALEHTADQGVYLDEHTALKEMGAALGKIAVALLFAGIALHTAIPTAFAISFVIVALGSSLALFGRRSVLF